MRPFDLDRRLASLASLGDPLRQDLYHLVAGRDDGVSSQEAATPWRVQGAGRLPPRQAGPGRAARPAQRRQWAPRAGAAGRPAVPAVGQPGRVALPARDYQLMAGLLAGPWAGPPGRSGPACSGRPATWAPRPRPAAAGAVAGRGPAPLGPGRARLRAVRRPGGAAAAQLPVRAAGRGPPRPGLLGQPGLPGGRAEAHAGRRALLDPHPGRCCVALVS